MCMNVSLNGRLPYIFKHVNGNKVGKKVRSYLLPNFATARPAALPSSHFSTQVTNTSLVLFLMSKQCKFPK